MKGIELMTAQALVTRIQAGTPPAIIDVRSRSEFARGHVPGAQHFSFWNIAAHVHEIAAEHTDAIVVYCGHGPRARWAAAALRRCGVGRVMLLEGHWTRWVREGRPQELRR